MGKLTVMVIVMNMTKRESLNCLRKEMQRRIEKEKEENVNGKKASLMILSI